MESLLTSLTEGLYGSVGLALAASFSWGIASVLLSPCHLSSIPLIIGFLTAREERRTTTGFVLSAVFALGILLTIALLGIITGCLGRLMGDLGPYAKYPIAIVFILVGLYLMEVVSLPASGFRLIPPRFQSAAMSALILGLLFGIALGPCTFAFMAPVLGVVFQTAGTNPIAAGSLLLAFAVGHCAVIMLAGGFVSRLQSYLGWTNRSNMIIWLKKSAGALVIIGGGYALYSL